jgi:uncharacterized protein
MAMNNKKPDEKALYFSRRLRQRMGKNVRKIFLFGSRARGDFHEGSDYDFFILLDKKGPVQKEEVLENEVEFLNKFDELSACVVYDEESWEWRKNSPLGINIEREGILL